ncbi:uncharacterized protein LOC135223000 [Macrobrachium nipponense]|uniref:uncharacterized protein LOC135223000 n=1 Tax=Macrobrachium nipponense TaxID=159736 RepID=UPI0030C82071
MWTGGEEWQGTVKLGQEDTNWVSFKYLGSVVSENGNLCAEVSNRIQCAWMNRRKSSGILCGRRISAKVKGKFYKSIVRLPMLYGAETWPIKKEQERRMEVAEMRMLRWMCGVTKRDKIRNELIKGTVKVLEVSKKAQERRIKWFGHVMRREEEHVCKKVMNMGLEGRRWRGRPKFRWKDKLLNDRKEKDLREQGVQDRGRWRRLTRNKDPI